MKVWHEIMPWRERFPIHEIGRIDGGRGFRTRKYVFRIGGNTFYDRKNKILIKIPEFKRSRIRLIAELRGILNGFPNQALGSDNKLIIMCLVSKTRTVTSELLCNLTVPLIGWSALELSVFCVEVSSDLLLLNLENLSKLGEEMYCSINLII
jgi:hypothetical protein